MRRVCAAESQLRRIVQEPATVEIMQAIISPRTLHELCKVALDTAEASDLDAGITLALLATLLSPGSLLSLRNLILGRCVNLALALPRVAHQVVAVSTTTAGQAVLDNLGAEHTLDCALAAAHLFVACSDASMLTKQHRLAILAAAALREARERCAASVAHGVQAVAATVRHLEAMHAASPDTPTFAPFQSCAVRSAGIRVPQRALAPRCRHHNSSHSASCIRRCAELGRQRGVCGSRYSAPHVLQRRHVSSVRSAYAGVLAHAVSSQPRHDILGGKRVHRRRDSELADLSPVEERR